MRTWPPPDRPRLEAVVDHVLQVLAHPNLSHADTSMSTLDIYTKAFPRECVRAYLSHEAVLVAVHARQLPHVRERVLQTVRLPTTNDTVPIRQGRGTRCCIVRG